MDLTGVPTPRMDWESKNLLETFKKFRQHVQLIFDGALSGKEEKVKVTYLLLWVGERGREIYNTFVLTEEQRKSTKTISDEFEKHVQPRSNPVFSRYKFKNEKQEDKSVESFITNLKTLSLECAFGDEYRDDMIRDQIIFGIKSEKIREKLITEGGTLTLAKAVQICHSYEYAQQQLKTMNSSSNVDSLKMRNSKPSNSKNRRSPGGQSDFNRCPRSKTPNTAQQKGHVSLRIKDNYCKNCGNKTHEKGTCPAKGKQCNFCRKWNHFSKVCRAKGVNDISCDEDQDELLVESVDSNISNGMVFAEICVGPKNTPINFKIDTGSQVNILPFSEFQKLGIKTALKKSNLRLTAYNGTPLKSMGTILLTCTHQNNGHSNSVEFHVVDTKSKPLFSLQTSVDFGLIKLTYSVESQRYGDHMTKQSVTKQYPQLFKGIGSLSGVCRIHLQPGAKPIVHPPRKIPVSLQDRCKAELDRMEKMGVIEKVSKPTEWVNSMVLVEKSQGKLRVCLDPTDLNKSIKRPYYPMRTLDDVLPSLNNSRYFTKLDARSGYWAIKLSEESSYLTCFNTIFGRYRYLRLPFGLCMSGDEFIKKMDECFEGLEGVVTIVDDILVHGRTRAEHDKNLKAVLDRALQRGLCFNEDKLEVGVSEVQYFGHLLTSEGLKPDPEKVTAIKNMPPPTNKPELLCLMGMINYLSRYAQNLSEITSPLRDLLQKDVEFSWQKPQSDAFEKVKEMLTSPGKVLGYYDPKKKLIMQSDSSRSGLGATLLQDNRPITYASKSLTASQKNYAMVELECLGILFGLRRFHQYCYGRKVIVETDHLPLIPIFKKPLHRAPARLQRMLLQMQRYDIEVKYRPGKEIPLPDTLSRRPISDTGPSLSDEADIQVNMVMASLPVSDRKMHEIKVQTGQDEQLSVLKQIILSGWPDNKKECQSLVTDFWNYRDELTVYDGVIMKGNKIVVPKSLRSNMIEIIHGSGHFGVEKSLRRARSALFWPSYSKHITEAVLNCPTCLEYRPSNQREPLQSYEIPDYPWQIVATDLFSWNDKNFLLVVDTYSHYFEVKELRNMKSATITNHMKGIFARMGIPEKVISDNGPCYQSSEFHEFAKLFDFQHVTSSPHYPQSNGFAEVYVKICKQIFTKAKAGKTDPLLGLLQYRVTPLDIGYSPSELLMGRQLRSDIPTSKENLLPRYISPKVVGKRLQGKKQRSKFNYDLSSKPLKPLSIGDSVRTQNPHTKTWKQAVVTDKHNERSYIVETSDGASYRRNRRHLMKTNEYMPPMPNIEIQSETESGDDLQTKTPPVKPINTPSFSQQESMRSPTQVSAKPDHTDKPNYITRYGRKVKPPIKIDM